MTDPKLDAIQRILSEVDAALREKLKEAGVSADHVILAVLPEGEGIIRSNVGADVLHEFAGMLEEIADEHQPGSRKRPN
jgi:hypothetical protein